MCWWCECPRCKRPCLWTHVLTAAHATSVACHWWRNNAKMRVSLWKAELQSGRAFSLRNVLISARLHMKRWQLSCGLARHRWDDSLLQGREREAFRLCQSLWRLLEPSVPSEWCCCDTDKYSAMRVPRCPQPGFPHLGRPSYPTLVYRMRSSFSQLPSTLNFRSRNMCWWCECPRCKRPCLWTHVLTAAHATSVACHWWRNNAKMRVSLWKAELQSGRAFSLRNVLISARLQMKRWQLSCGLARHRWDDSLLSGTWESFSLIFRLCQSLWRLLEPSVPSEWCCCDTDQYFAMRVPSQVFPIWDVHLVQFLCIACVHPSPSYHQLQVSKHVLVMWMPPL